MDARIFDLIVKLHEGGSASSEELEQSYCVGDRTIRTLIRRANDELEDTAEIVRSRDRRYCLSIKREDGFAQKLRAMQRRAQRDLPSNADERVQYILSDLLAREAWVTIETLASRLYVSARTISTDLRVVEQRLNVYGLQLERRSHRGLRVRGDEMKRRLCLAHSVLNKLGSMGAFADVCDVGDENNGVDLDGLIGNYVNLAAGCVASATELYRFEINPVAYQNLLVHIALAILRIQHGGYIPIESLSIGDLQDRREFAIARNIAERIESSAGIELPESEISYIAMHLAAKEIIASPVDEKEGVSEESWILAERLLDEVHRSFRFDFRDDLELMVALARHIGPLTVRVRNGLNLVNPLLKDIKARYVLAYSMARDSAWILEEHCGGVLSEDELGYIALSFAWALERLHGAHEKKNVLVVCASGVGSARLLVWQLEKAFPNSLGTVATCTYQNVVHADFADIDYVFSTVPIPDHLPVPVFRISSFLDSGELESIRSTLSASYEDDFACRFLSEDLFIPTMNCASKHDVIESLSERMVSAGFVDEAFLDLVLQREELCSTGFGLGVAIPHPIRACGRQTIASIATLRNPVAWDEQGTMVDVVVLASFSSVCHEETEAFFENMATVLTSEELISELRAAKTWPDLLGVLNKGLRAR